MSRPLQFALLLICLTTVNGQVDSFANFLMLQVQTNGQNHQQFLAGLDTLSVSVWRRNVVQGEPVRVLVPPIRLNQVNALIRTLQLTSTPVAALSRVFPNEAAVNAQQPSSNSYMTIQQQQNFLRQLATSNAQNVRLIALGNTQESRPIMGVELGGPRKPAVVIISCGFDSSQWLSHAACFQLINLLLTTNQVYLANYTVQVFPNMNPDGYAYTWTTNRLWRKNRRVVNASSPCAVGVDLNSNFPTYWEAGTGSPCSELFRGTRASSELEVSSFLAHVQNDVVNRNGLIEGYFDVQAYGQEWLWAPGWPRDNYTANIRRQVAFGDAGLGGLRSSFNRDYKSSTLWTRDDRGGQSVDHFDTAFGTNLSAVIKLRPAIQRNLAVACNTVPDDLGLFYPENEIANVSLELLTGIFNALTYRSHIRSGAAQPLTILPDTRPTQTEPPFTGVTTPTVPPSANTLSLIATLALALIALTVLIVLCVVCWYDLYHDYEKEKEDSSVDYVPLPEELSHVDVHLDTGDYDDLDFADEETGHRSHFQPKTTAATYDSSAENYNSDHKTKETTDGNENINLINLREDKV